VHEQTGSVGKGAKDGEGSTVEETTESLAERNGELLGSIAEELGERDDGDKGEDEPERGTGFRMMSNENERHPRQLCTPVKRSNSIEKARLTPSCGSGRRWRAERQGGGC
jgi:hypothetical protein